jgi:hypothetical protein
VSAPIKIALAGSTIASSLIILFTISLLSLPGTGLWTLAAHKPTDKAAQHTSANQTQIATLLDLSIVREKWLPTDGHGPLLLLEKLDPKPQNHPEKGVAILFQLELLHRCGTC